MSHPARAYLKKLKEAYRNKTLVPFVGAGVSFPLKQPGWGRLLEKIFEEFDYEKLNQKRSEIESLIEANQYLEAVDLIKEAGITEIDLKYSISQLIHEFRNNTPSNIDNLYQDLADLNCTKYLTTNYDNYLSDYLGKAPKNLTQLSQEYINEIDGPIYKSAVYNLHGDFTEPSTIVLSRESYDKLYKEDDDFTKVLEHFRKKYTLLFIGFSLEDEYIQEVLEVGNKLRARHFILVSEISQKRRKELEEKFDVKIIKYSVENNDHTSAIREILNEIKYVEKDKKAEPVPSQAVNRKSSLEFQSQTQTGTQFYPLLNKNSDEKIKDSKIHEQIKEIKKLQKDGYLDRAAAEYNKILQQNIVSPLSSAEQAVIITELLAIYILTRDYSAAETLIDSGIQLPKNRENIELLSYIIDFYFNTNNHKKAFNIAQKWYENMPDDSLVYSFKLYTEIIYYDKGFNYLFDKLIDQNYKLIIDVKDDNEMQFVYRLAGEIAFYYKNFGKALNLLRQAYEIDANIYNLEDLAISSYFKAVEPADDGNKIKIAEINIDQLNKALEYFEVAFSSAKENFIKGVYSRLAALYLRTLFYLQKAIKFDRHYQQLIDYCADDLDEIKRLKAINDLSLNKIDWKLVNNLNEIDRSLLLTEWYTKQQMPKKAVKEIKPLADKYIAENEEIILQYLITLFNAGQKNIFNQYYAQYQKYWPESSNLSLMKSYYSEMNGDFEQAEKILFEIISEFKTVINYNHLFLFYRRTDQIPKIEAVYAELLENNSELVNQDADGFFSTYHQYLMSLNKIREAYNLFQTAKEYIPNSDVLKFMEVEIKVKLLDFTNLAEISLELYEKYKDYGESIFAYYAAVACLHYNQFEEAGYYLSLYKENGYVDQKSLHLVEKVEDRLNILQQKKEPPQDQSSNYIRNTAFKTGARSKQIKIPKNGDLIFDAPSLYLIFYFNQEEWLLDNPQVIVSFTTVDRLQQIYCDTGDALLFKIIKFLSENKHVKIMAPTIEDSLKNREVHLTNFIDFFDSLSLAVEHGYAFATSYFLPLGQQNNRPFYLPGGFKTIKIVDGEINVYTG
jgi:hypothetical protein